MRVLNRLSQAIARLRSDAEGVAAVEFALVVPVLLLLYVGAMEASALISMDRRVQTIAGAMGDLVSRANVKIAACDVKDYFQASAGIIAPYPTKPLQQLVTSVFVKANGDTEVMWSQPAGGATPRTKGDPYPLPTAMKNIALNAYVIVSEASYAYTPITGIIYDHPIQLHRDNFYMPRFGGNIVIDPTTTTGC